jgi:hypothetical protein
MIKENQHSRAHWFSFRAPGGKGHNLLDLLAVQALIPFQNIIDGCTLLQVFKNGGNRKSGSTKNPGATHFFRVAFYPRAL